MLKQRVITALVLLAVLLPALFAHSSWPFALIVLLMVTAGAWEWGRLNGMGAVGSIATAAAMLLAGLCTGASDFLLQPHPILWLVVGGAWILSSVWLVRAGVPGWSLIPQWLRWVVGLMALWSAGVAMLQARGIGINFLLSVLLLVWVADVFAYFAGRAFGLKFTKVKLAPSISPGKSWEGVWGGALGVLVMAGLWVWMDAVQSVAIQSFYSRLFQQGWWLLIVAVLLMTAMSVIGDLVESLIKRSAGVKDSSQLLPGHGGVLDRIDALLPTLPLAMMLTSLVQ